MGVAEESTCGEQDRQNCRLRLASSMPPIIKVSLATLSRLGWALVCS